jgi:phosphate transport system substrate-binding protein
MDLPAWGPTKARTILTFAAVLITAASVSARAVDISGAGATYPYVVYAKWAEAFKKATGNTVNYQSIGSGGGVKQITARTITFGASDRPLSPKELADNDLIQWPMVLGGIVPIVNISGISTNALTLDGETLANIYLGEIKTWDDERIKKLNPEKMLPPAAIVVVHQSDGSGTTFNFTNYLSKVSADWKSKIGSGDFVKWPVGVGAKGCAGVLSDVQRTENSIGYVEIAYAKQYKLTTLMLMNRDGKVVAANAETIEAAAADADWEHAEDFDLIITNQTGAKTWPISASTFILMPKRAMDAAAAKGALQFFSWAYAKGDSMATELDYVPMPERLKKLALLRLGSIKGPGSEVLCQSPQGCCPDC